MTSILAQSPAKSATWSRVQHWLRHGTGVLLASGICAYAPQVKAQALICDAATVKPSCSATGVWDFCCVPGFVLADNTATGAASISMTVGENSLQIQQNFKSNGCCVAPYANIGIYDGGARSDQYGKPGSHLPIQLKDIARLEGAWTFKVPMPLNPNWQVEQYRVYFEMFLSGTPEGHADSGNITINFFWNNYGFNAITGHAPINGPRGMDYIDHGNPFGQGPFIDFLYPEGTFVPDSDGTVTVTSTDIKAVLDWAVANFPKYYNGNIYLSSLSLAEEAGAFHGTVTTSYASFAVQKTGSDVVFTPPWSSTRWDGTGGAAAGGSSSVSTRTGGAPNNTGGNAQVGGRSGTSARTGGRSGTSVRTGGRSGTSMTSGGGPTQGTGGQNDTNPQDSGGTGNPLNAGGSNSGGAVFGTDTTDSSSGTSEGVAAGARSPSESSGCGCRAASRRPRDVAVVLLSFALLAFARRRVHRTT